MAKKAPPLVLVDDPDLLRRKIRRPCGRERNPPAMNLPPKFPDFYARPLAARQDRPRLFAGKVVVAGGEVCEAGGPALRVDMINPIEFHAA
jgi:hypothetical protein